MADNIPTHHSSEKNKGMLVVAGGVAASLPLILTTVQFGPLVGLLSGSDFNAETWDKVGNYMGGLYDPRAIASYYKYSWSQWPMATAAGGLISMAIGAAPAIVAAAVNPFRMFDLIHGDARLGNKRDVREMERRSQVGIVGADKLVLGNWPKTTDRMALIETLSVLVLAPPGTGKTASFVVPSIIETDGSSFIVNDPKPELFEACSGHRAEIGHVFMINWSATDKVDPDHLDDPTKTIFYPRFNVLSPQLTPPAGTAERDTYLDAIANVLSPGGDKGGKNDYFEQKGRAGLVGFLHYICSKVNDARDYYGLPEFWRGKEACIPMIVDMINEGLRRAAAENDRLKPSPRAAITTARRASRPRAPASPKRVATSSTSRAKASACTSRSWATRSPAPRCSAPRTSAATSGQSTQRPDLNPRLLTLVGDRGFLLYAQFIRTLLASSVGSALSQASGKKSAEVDYQGMNCP